LRFLLGQRGGEGVFFSARLIAVIKIFAFAFEARYMIVDFLQVE
jgi:hypothetical protein